MQVSYKYCSAVHFIFSHVVLYKLIMSVVCKNVVSYFVTLGMRRQKCCADILLDVTSCKVFVSKSQYTVSVCAYALMFVGVGVCACT
jgi:hypothetical protein